MRRARGLVAASLTAAVLACDATPEAAAVATGQAGEASTLGLAESLYAAGAHDSAAALFTIALREARQRADASLEARLLTWLGLTAMRTGDYPAARRLGQEALDLKLRRGLRDDLFRSYNALGLLAYNESRYIEAVSRYEEGMKVAEAESDSLNLAKAWTNLALALFELGDFTRARTLLNDALGAARRSGDQAVEGRVLTNIGMLLVRTGSPVPALAHLHAARRLAGSSGDRANELNALGQLATAWMAVGEPASAIAALDTALRLAREPGRESRLEEASALDQMAQVYVAAGDPRRAIAALEQAMALQQAEGLPHERASSLRTVALIQSSLGNHALAEKAATEALTAHRGLDTPLEVVWDLLALAELRHRAGHRDAAWRHIGEARTLAGRLTASSAEALVALSEARLADAESRAAEVLRLARESGGAITQAGAEHEWELQTMAARAHSRLGHRDSAIAAARRGVAAVERIRGQHGSSILRTSYLANRSSAYGQLAGLLVEAGRVAEALPVADAARGRTLVEYLATRGDSSGASDVALAEEERQLLRQIDLLAEAVATEADTGGALAGEAARTRERLEEARAEFSERFARAGGSDVPALSGLSVTDLQGRLGPDEVLLEYLVTDAGALVFAVTRDSLVAVPLAVDGEVAARARVAREAGGRPDAPVPVLRTTLESLGSDLLGAPPVQAALRGRRAVVIVPHGDLTYVPFAALANPATGRALVEHLAITYAPSAAAVVRLREQAGKASTGPVTAFAPFPRELPQSGPEVRAVRLGRGGNRITGRAATEMAVRRALATSRVVHVASHGVLNRQNPLFSRVDLARHGQETPADDGRLEVHEIVGIPVRAALVFLSGCETAAGTTATTQFERGEDFATLAQAFLLAGARNVVATLWKVRDDGAEAFSRYFYSALERVPGSWAGHGVAWALAEAQRSMRADPRYAAPYYWAGYTVSGTGSLSGGNPSAGVR